MKIDLPKHKKLILFDGVCNLCNSSVNFVIKNDSKGIFMFAPLQSKVGQWIIEKHHIDISTIDSILLYSHQKPGLKIKSSAALSIASKLSFPFSLMAIFFIVPSVIRDWVYDYIAKHRYRWFGKKTACMVPSEATKNRFFK